MSTVSTNPAILFKIGNWEALPAGRVLLAQGTSTWGLIIPLAVLEEKINTH